MSQNKDEQATELYQDESTWLPPVPSKDALPESAVLGAFIFVEDEGAVYQYTAEDGWFTTKKPKGGS